MILEPPKIKSGTISTVSPSISQEVMGPDAMILLGAIKNINTALNVRISYYVYKALSEHLLM